MALQTSEGGCPTNPPLFSTSLQRFTKFPNDVIAFFPLVNKTFKGVFYVLIIDKYLYNLKINNDIESMHLIKDYVRTKSSCALRWRIRQAWLCFLNGSCATAWRSRIFAIEFDAFTDCFDNLIVVLEGK